MASNLIYFSNLTYHKIYLSSFLQ
jgi:hypothetical protein